MSYEIAKFWESRVKFNNKTKKYDIIGEIESLIIINLCIKCIID